MKAYLRDDLLFLKSDLPDLLDAITLIFRSFASKRIGDRAEKYISEVRRIFAETGMAFRIDDEGGVHPLIDQAFEASRASAVRALAGPQFVAARAAIKGIDDALMEDPQNYLRAVRSAFEAVENIFKQTFPGVTHLNGAVIDKYLSKLSSNADVITANDQHSFVKQVRAFTNWVDSVHFYRHASGEPEPAPPSEDHSILLISMGLSYSRWIAWLFNRIAAARVVPRI